MDSAQTLLVEMKEGIFGTSAPRQLYLLKGDIFHFCSFNEIEANAICFYFRVLYKKLLRFNKIDAFAFTPPSQVGQQAGRPETRAQNIANRMQNITKGRALLAPSNVGSH